MVGVENTVLRCDGSQGKRLTKGSGNHQLEIFFLPAAPNQKETDQSSLGSLNYIFCGHFDEINFGVHPSGGVGLAVKDGGYGDVRHLRKILVAILKNNICMLCRCNLQSTLELSFPFFISQKPGETLIFITF